MVGAAGFELATSSTQNLRATKLRYVPPGMTLPDPIQHPVNKILRRRGKGRKHHFIAGFQPQPRGLAAADFNHAAHGLTR